MLFTVHGRADYRKPLQRTLRKTVECLLGGSGLLRKVGPWFDAVVRTINIMEDSVLFNANLGAILPLDSLRRLDAALMKGKALKQTA